MVHEKLFLLVLNCVFHGNFRQKSTKMVYSNPQLNDFNHVGVLPL